MKHIAPVVIVSGLIVGSFAFPGCVSTAHKMNEVSVGMTKAEVVAKLGNPDSTRANQGAEYLIYRLRDHIEIDPIKAQNAGEEYFVRLKEGRVEAYGKVGDFGSAK